MTAKDYVKIAATIKSLTDDLTRAQSKHGERPLWPSSRFTVALRFATMLKKDNDRFDADRFYDACGISEDI